MALGISVLFVSSEAATYVGTGALADASANLPLAVRECGHDIRLTFPKYGFMSERRNRIHEITRLKEFEVPIAGGKDMAFCKSSSLNNAHAKVQVYVVGNQTYFGSRMGIYADPATSKEYSDNGERFAFFCRSVLETCKLLGWRPTIIHCNDWQTALVPAYAKLLYAGDGFFTNTKFVYTIYNIREQGSFDKSLFDITELPRQAWSRDGVQLGNRMNFMKAGIQYADVITTVSQAYAAEICTRGGGFGLEEFLAQRKKSRQFIGILNGIDYDAWNPARDSSLPQKYTRDSVDDKMENKRVLCEKFRLPFNSDVPLICFTGNLTDETGAGLLVPALGELAKLNAQFIFNGTGDAKYQDAFARFAKKSADSVAFSTDRSDSFTHLLYAASDIALIPFHSEPGGVAQLRALRYGAVPVAFETGGLADSVSEGAKGAAGTGFVFKKFNSSELVRALKRALTVWNDHDAWLAIQENGMTKNYGWRSSAEKYSDIYKEILKKD